jgi:hypothetical protein
LIGAIALAVLVTIVIAIPRLRGIVAGKAAEVKQDIGDSLGVFRSPTKVVMIFGGNLLAVLLYSVVLGLCVHAFGHSLSFADLVLTYTVVTIFAGAGSRWGGSGVASTSDRRHRNRADGLGSFPTTRTEGGPWFTRRCPRTIRTPTARSRRRTPSGWTWSRSRSSGCPMKARRPTPRIG